MILSENTSKSYVSSELLRTVADLLFKKWGKLGSHDFLRVSNRMCVSYTNDDVGDHFPFLSSNYNLNLDNIYLRPLELILLFFRAFALSLSGESGFSPFPGTRYPQLQDTFWGYVVRI